MPEYRSLERLAAEAEARQLSIGGLVLEDAVATGEGRESLLARMGEHLAVMRASVERGLTEAPPSHSGLVGREGRLMEQARRGRRTLSGEATAMAAARAMAVACVNAAMGKVVAAPTAGSCGVLPGALLTVAGDLGSSEAELVMALFTAAGIGQVIASQAFLAGAEGGCQAECGAAAAMAAAAVVELAGGSPTAAVNAAALVFKGCIGLVCDPVAGLVEVPCVKRNGLFAANALVAADMSLAGIQTVIPPDEVLQAVREVGRGLPVSLRETAGGGLAATATARSLERVIFGSQRDGAPS